MTTHLRTLILALVAALLLLQPAARAGAGCAETMLTGSCACTESSAVEGTASCCQGGGDEAPEESTPDDGQPQFGTDSGCACTASPLPELPGAPKTADAEAGSIVERLALATSCAQEQRADVVATPEARPPRPRVRAHVSTIPRASTARTLSFLGTWLR